MTSRLQQTGLPTALLLAWAGSPAFAVAQEAPKTQSITLFGGSAMAPRADHEVTLAEQLAATLQHRGIKADIAVSAVRGSHSGFLGDNDFHDIQHALDRLEDVCTQRPGTTIVQFGMNDSWIDDDDSQSRIPVGAFERNLTEIVNALRASESRVILMTPSRIGPPPGAAQLTRIGLYAHAVRRIARRYRVDCVDVWQTHEHVDGTTDESISSLQPDDTQPSDTGLELTASLLADRLTNRTARDPMIAINLPIIDLSGDHDRQVTIDREAGQYLGHVTTVLLENRTTLFAVYPKGHGQGQIVLKRSDDGGHTWSERLPTPATWATSKEVPTIHRVTDAAGAKRLIMWSGLHPARLAISEDDGSSWSELEPAGDWGGIVVMSFVEPLREPGHYLAMFHDDGRFFTANGKSSDFTLYKTFSRDGGLTWSFPEPVWSSRQIHLCEPGCIRSPDGRQLAVLLRENTRRRNSHIIFSDDEGKTWSSPRELPLALTGDRHTLKYADDGRIVATFRDRTYAGRRSDFNMDEYGEGSPTEGDWVAWVGTYDDLANDTEGQYRLRLMDNHRGWDTGYPGLEILSDGTLVATTYGSWTAGEAPYIVSVRFKLKEVDQLASARKR